MKRAPILLALIVAGCWLAACGSIGDRYGSTNAAPATGVAPWYKVDLDPTVDLAQPYILYGDRTHILTEPAYFLIDDRHVVFYEIVELDRPNGAPTGSAIAFAQSDDGFAWQVQNAGAPVLVADQVWEGDFVGGPTVLWHDGRFQMWYAGGGGAGLGYAESDDGLNWDKRDANPVFAPDQEWEGSVVASPSVVVNQGDYHLYYSAGDVEGPALARRVGQAIGHATSADGVHWTRDTGNPVLVAEAAWEGVDPDGETGGSVCCPMVRVDRPADRDVFRLYYTGNRLGEPVLDDVGIGYAGSFDGAHFEKVAEYNPVVNERFPLTVFGVSQYLIYGESAASVIRLGNTYRMMFSQTDLLDAKQGLAVAVHPHPDSY
jgi:hypothetical protein